MRNNSVVFHFRLFISIAIECSKHDRTYVTSSENPCHDPVFKFLDGAFGFALYLAVGFSQRRGRQRFPRVNSYSCVLTVVFQLETGSDQRLSNYYPTLNGHQSTGYIIFLHMTHNKHGRRLRTSITICENFKCNTDKKHKPKHISIQNGIVNTVSDMCYTYLHMIII